MAADTDSLEIVESPGGIEITVKVVPGASRSRVAGTWGTALKVAVSAPPEGGRANAAVIALLARSLGVRKSDVTIVSGHTQPRKRVRIAGLSADELRRLLMPR